MIVTMTIEEYGCWAALAELAWATDAELADPPAASADDAD